MADYSYDVAVPALGYYATMSMADAIQIADEQIEEWDYADDPAGYCHHRPVLLKLVQAARLALEMAEGPLDGAAEDDLRQRIRAL